MPLVSLAVLFSDNPLEEIREVVRLLRPAVLQFLVDTFGIKPIETPEEDLAAILG